jgi:hypothetical protein
MVPPGMVFRLFSDRVVPALSQSASVTNRLMNLSGRSAKLSVEQPM